MPGRTDSRLRMGAILLVFAVLGTAAGLRLGYWQVVAADELTAGLQASAGSTAAGPVVRADIVDRDGELLAKLVTYDQLAVHPAIIDPADHAEIIETLDEIFGLEPAERESYLSVLADTEKEYAILRKRLTFEESDAVQAARVADLLPGISLEPMETRRYTVKGGQSGTSLAAHVIGFVRADNRGGEGVERYYDERLTTVDADLLDLASIDDPSSALGDLSGIEPAPLELTIDADLQKQVEKELTSVWRANDAKSVSAIVMDPKTGAILAAASVPSYDANRFAEVASEDISRLRNRVFSDQYEPGSVMKIFTVTAALREGKVTPNTKIRDQVVLKFGDDEIQNADHGSNGLRTVKDQIAESRNVVASKLARMLAPGDTQRAAHKLYDLWETVGVAGRTGTDISGEATGTWRDPDTVPWQPLELANHSFGQGVAATLPQLARGVSTLVNGGYLVQPHLVVGGEAASVEPVRVLEAKYARQAKDILTHVTGSVARYAERALIKGYDIGGKTGTAQIWDVKKADWKKNRFNHSFVGFVGGRDQEYVIAVRIEEPVPLKHEQGSIPLNVESTELFRGVAQATIDKLGMKKSRDKAAGRPIIGTGAAAALDPVRNREALRQSKLQQRDQAAKATKAAAGKHRGGQEPRLASGSSADGDPT